MVCPGLRETMESPAKPCVYTLLSHHHGLLCPLFVADTCSWSLSVRSLCVLRANGFVLCHSESSLLIHCLRNGYPFSLLVAVRQFWRNFYVVDFQFFCFSFALGRDPKEHLESPALRGHQGVEWVYISNCKLILYASINIYLCMHVYMPFIHSFMGCTLLCGVLFENSNYLLGMGCPLLF